MRKNVIKKILCAGTALLIFAVPLAGCQSEPAQESSDVVSESSAVSAPAESEPVQSSETSGIEAIKTPEEAGLSESDTYETETSETSGQLFELYNADGIQIQFIQALDYETNTVCYWLKSVNGSEKEFYADLVDIVWNDIYMVENTSLGTQDVGREYYSEMDELKEAVNASGEDVLRSLSFKLVITDAQTYETAAEEAVLLEIPEGSTPGLFYEPCLSASAEEQVLLDNDEVRITLLHLSRLLSTSYTHRDLTGFIRFDNKTDAERPVGVESISINGMSVDIIADHKVTLKGHDSCIQTFRVTEDTLEENNITSIYEVALMAISDESELTGTFVYSGGSWYDVLLSEAGISDESAQPAGELVFDEADVQIYLTGCERKDWSFAEEEDEHNYTWNLTVVNNRDEDVDLDLIDQKINGEDETDDLHFYLDSDSEIGYHSRRNMPLKMYDFPSEHSPELSFKVRLRTVGGGAILYISDNIVVIPSGLS